MSGIKGRWPEPGFFDVMNVKVRSCEVPNERLIVLEFDIRPSPTAQLAPDLKELKQAEKTEENRRREEAARRQALQD